MESFSAQLLSWFPAEEPALVKTLSAGGALDGDTRAKLNAALARFTEAL